MKQFTARSLLFFIWSSISFSGIAAYSKIPSHSLSPLIGQQSQIRGKVIDKETGEAIPYCNIAIESSSIGTASN